MRFLSIYKCAESAAPPSPEFMAKMQKLVEDGMKAGTLLATEGCLPSAMGARVRFSDRQFIVTDGPFVESKEVIGGFAILEAKSKAHALDLVREFLSVAGEGECELRQIFTEGDCGQTAGDLHAELKAQYAGR